MKIIRTVLKWIGILLLSLLVASIIGIAVLLVKNYLFLEPADDHFVEYLNKNKVLLNEEAFGTGKQMFDEELYHSKVILLGESHGLADVQTIDKSIFLHLNKQTGLRHYVAEMDSTRANLLNTFLGGMEKDTVLLKQIVLAIGQRIPQQSGLELYQKWSDIYDYNQSLPDSSRLKVIGIDTDFGVKSSISRDSAMIINFRNIIEKEGLHDKQFYGLFGLFHILQSGMNENNFQPFAARLKSNGFSVQSIMCANVDSDTYFPSTTGMAAPPSEKISFLNMDGPIVLVKGINDLKKASKKNTITLFNISKKNSPYTGSNKLISMKTNFINQNMFPYDSSLSICDFIQYGILIRNSEAITPLDGN